MPMPVEVTDTEVEGVLVVEAGCARDDRGWFSELYSRETWGARGFQEVFVQDNLSWSRRGTLRGLHYQLSSHPMGKLVRALTGAIFDVAVDLRQSSPTFGKWVGRELTAENRRALWVPSGFAHGFLALSDDALVLYKCTGTHAPEAERAIHFADDVIGIDWPVEPTLVSEKDRAAPLLADAEHDFR